MFYLRFPKFMVMVLLLLLTSAASFEASILFARTQGGLIYTSTDSARTWQPYGVPFTSASVVSTQLVVDPRNTNIGGQDAQVSFSGPQGAFAGLDQANVLLPRSLAGSGSVNIVLNASGQTANTVNISVKQVNHEDF